MLLLSLAGQVRSADALRRPSMHLARQPHPHRLRLSTTAIARRSHFLDLHTSTKPSFAASCRRMRPCPHLPSHHVLVLQPLHWCWIRHPLGSRRSSAARVSSRQARMTVAASILLSLRPQSSRHSYRPLQTLSSVCPHDGATRIGTPLSV